MMNDYGNFIPSLAWLFKKLSEDESALDELRRDKNLYADHGRDAEDDIRLLKNRIASRLRGLNLLPPEHRNRHGAKLEQFYLKLGEFLFASKVKPPACYNNSVLIMTKFPDQKLPDPKDAELERVINAVATSIDQAGFCPRIAKQPHHDWLWDNVELYLLGCGLGIAIVEDKYKPELNPNVALEWGWMKGMCKPVLFLEESTFSHPRADWEGLISAKFDWDNPEADVDQAISIFLKTRAIGLPDKLIG